MTKTSIGLFVSPVGRKYMDSQKKNIFLLSSDIVQLLFNYNNNNFLNARQATKTEKKIRISFTEETEGWGSSFASHAKYSITHTYSTTTCERNTYRRTKAGEREKSFNDYDHHSCNLDSNIRELCSSKRKCERIQSKISFSWYFKPEISLN